MVMEVYIIGGGASGLVAAIAAAQRGFKVKIIEKNNKCGKKLLISGNGRANFWNKNQNINFYHSSDISLFEKIFENRNKVLSFFDNIGLIYREKDGYYYPFTNQSQTLLNALLNKANELNIEIEYDECVIDILKKNKFIIVTENKKYYADYVVIATGSKAYPKTGSDGFGYEVLKKFGHSLIEVLPSLVQVVGSDTYYNIWDGVRSIVNVSLIENGKIIKEEYGEIQFTKYGLSGICVFNLSSLISRGLNKNKNEIISINFVPWFKGSKENFIDWLNNQIEKRKNSNLSNILELFLNYKIVKLILNISKIEPNDNWDNINKEILVENIMNFTFRVKNTKDFENAQVCCGGIPLSEININSMESLKVKNLYIIGELLDVDGDCGGYNLGFAWMSGIIAGNNIGK